MGETKFYNKKASREIQLYYNGKRRILENFISTKISKPYVPLLAMTLPTNPKYYSSCKVGVLFYLYLLLCRIEEKIGGLSGRLNLTKLMRIIFDNRNQLH